MFTGIIEAVGRIVSAERRGPGLSLRVDLGALASGTKPGDSVAVSGPCLTVAELSGSVARFDAVAETVERTTLASWRAGRAVNLERAVAAGSRLGGHFVTGHIDGRSRVLSVRRVGDGAELDFAIPAGCGKLVAEKGSVALDGVSLTVARLLSEESFRVALVPHTLGATTLGSLGPGDDVNFEADILARYAARLLGREAASGGGLTEEKLREHGFA
jgi:riboflavin synthase